MADMLTVMAEKLSVGLKSRDWTNLKIPQLALCIVERNGFYDATFRKLKQNNPHII